MQTKGNPHHRRCMARAPLKLSLKVFGPMRSTTNEESIISRNYTDRT
jgi:hypothetical protein